MNMRKQTWKTAVSAAAIAASATVSARSLLYYYDFDAVEDGALVYEGANKGTGTASVTLKDYGSSILGYATGVLGSAHAFNSNLKSGLWIGDGTTSMGCGTSKGFTIACWVKTDIWHSGAWTDFFGFRLGGYDYRCEYVAGGSTSTPNPPFQIYGGLATGTSSSNQLIGDSNNITELPAGAWKHFALVFSPSTNSMTECGVYVDGARVNTLKVLGAGNLQCVRLGTLQMKNGAEYSHSAQTANTAIDELAVFDYPVSLEQLKWLCRFRPGQPSGGPARTMPVMWHFDETDGRGLNGKNTGTGDYATFKWNPKNYSGTGYNDYANYTSGAFGSTHGFVLDYTQNKYWSIFCVTNLEETLGSGYSFSFWLKAPDGAQSWRSIFGYVVGGKNFRLAWDGSSPRKLYAGGATSGSATFGGWTPDAWNHICVTWNAADKKTDVYIDGTRRCQLAFNAAIAASAKISRITVGPWAEGSNISDAFYSAYKGVVVDEFAFFNHSLSPEQITWLGSRLPAMPPLDATNLVRTVSASGAWAGGLASWTVREWDDVGEAWVNTTRTTIYPALEDTDVEVAVALADGVELTNDTFVTPKKLSLRSDGVPAVVGATLKTTVDSRFAPQSLDVDEGVVLTASVGDVLAGRASLGDIAFGADAKIVFDVTDCTERITRIPVGNITLPDGEDDVSAHFGTTGRSATLNGGVFVVSHSSGEVQLRFKKGFMVIVK